MLKIATLCFWVLATCVAKFRAKAVLPIAGLAAIIINSPGCSPVVILSSAYHPVPSPVISFLFSAKTSKLFSVLANISFIDLNSDDFLFLIIFNIFFSDSSNISFIGSSES